jgi:hypothetical protein
MKNLFLVVENEGKRIGNEVSLKVRNLEVRLDYQSIIENLSFKVKRGGPNNFRP